MEAGAFEKLKETLWGFMKTDIYPNELLFFEQIEDLFLLRLHLYLD